MYDNGTIEDYKKLSQQVKYNGKDNCDIVEDYKKLLQQLKEYKGEDGVEAVAKYNELKPDLVTLDITMPNKDGIQALKEIKAADPNATCVMCSAMGQQSMVIEAIQSGAKDFIVKPFQADRVLESIRKILD